MALFTKIALVAAAALALLAPGASAAGFAPVDRAGPPLGVGTGALDRSVRCSSNVASAGRPTVLLIHGTALDIESNFSWNYVPALRAAGIPHCTVDLPDHAMADIQVAAEYVVHAIRTAGARSGRRVQIIGFSQGGMIGRWALRFWPDTRRLVEDVVGLAPSNHGTLNADAFCAGPCPAAFWQQRSNARFGQALNSFAETFAGIDYTVAYTHSDEVVVPNQDQNGSSALHTGAGRVANIALQEVCPTDGADHLALGSYDPVGYALALDAITHPGPASAARVGLGVCAQAFMPGVDPAGFAANYGHMGSVVADQLLDYPRVGAEPPLKCYVLADRDCVPPAITGLRLSRKRFRPSPAGRVRRGRGTRIRFRLSEPALLRFRIERLVRRRWRHSRTFLRRRGAGARSVLFSGRVRVRAGHDRALRPGRYRMLVRAIDAAGNRSGVSTRRFRVVHRKRPR
jgi:hypothetical protein